MSEEKPKPSYYAIIPAHVRYDKSLTANAKLLYGEITALCSVEGYCWASNRYFAELYGVKIRAVQNWIDALREAGHILVDPIDGYKRHIRLPEAERAARVKKDTHANKDMPHANKDMGGVSQKTRRYVNKDTHSITSNLTMNNTKSIAAVAASDFSLSLSQIAEQKEQKEAEQEKPVPVPVPVPIPKPVPIDWDSLGEKQKPFMLLAEKEVMDTYRALGKTPPYVVIVSRARTLYNVSIQKGVAE